MTLDKAPFLSLKNGRFDPLIFVHTFRSSCQLEAQGCSDDSRVHTWLPGFLCPSCHGQSLLPSNFSTQKLSKQDGGPHCQPIPPAC